MQEKQQKISPIKKRILQFAESLGISKRDFYAKIGVSRGTLESPTGITEDIVAKFIATYKEVSIEWLLTGEGPMLRQSSSPIYKDNQERTAVAKYAAEGIPLIPIEAFAGFGTGNSTQVMEYESERYIVPDFRGAEFLVQVKGNSMYPKYSSGDIVACKKLPLDTFFQWNKVYVIDSEQGVLIKRVKPATDNDHIILVSENERYDPFPLHRQEITSLAIVIGVIRVE